MERLGPDDPDQEYAKALTIAKEALKYIGVFRTPPTPGVYDVWYRYVEGLDKDLHEQLKRAVTVSKSVSMELLEFYYQQRIADLAGSQATEAVKDKLAHELSSLTKLISVQLNVNDEFDKDMLSARSSIDELTPTPQMIRQCIEQMLASNEAMRDQLKAAREELQQSQAQLEQLEAELTKSQKSLLTDPLTGIGNRRFFQAAIRHALSRRHDGNGLAYLIMLDIDKFQAINDSHGSCVGNDVLEHTSQVLGTALPNASIARLECDEFAIIGYVQRHEDVAEQVALIREQFAGKALFSDRIGKRLGQITVSMGCALLRESDDESSWVERAQKLLESAKYTGANQAMIERVI